MTEASQDCCNCSSYGSPLVCSIVVIDEQKWVQRQTRRSAVSE